MCHLRSAHGMSESGWLTRETVTGSETGSILDQCEMVEEDWSLVRMSESEGQHAGVSGLVLLQCQGVLRMRGEQGMNNTENPGITAEILRHTHTAPHVSLHPQLQRGQGPQHQVAVKW